MIRNTTKLQKFGWVLFILYLIALTYFLFFAESFGRVPGAQTDYAYNLMPFREISRFIKYRGLLGFQAVLLNMAGNVLGFVPFGFFIPVVSRRGRSEKCGSYGIGFSLCIELTQLIFKIGSFDVDDILLNTTGSILGYLAYWKVQKIRVRRKIHGRNKTDK